MKQYKHRRRSKMTPRIVEEIRIVPNSVEQEDSESPVLAQSHIPNPSSIDDYKFPSMASRGAGRSGSGGRGRSRRDYPAPSHGQSSRFEEKSRGSGNPPSRNLWVGNLAHSTTESDLTDYFVRFGELESMAFQPGRSYAFVNFLIEEEAVAAMKSLQGFSIAGNPLRIEFAKADKKSSSTTSDVEDYLPRREEQRSSSRGSPFSKRDSRTSYTSPEPSYPDKSKAGDNRSGEPSEVLWVGFPVLLKVDEMILRRAFSSFGEIEKITVFPGRSYAFVRFRNIMSACRAKETLNGKLFGNPRVQIFFAKSEAGSSSSNSGRSSMTNGMSGSSENYRSESKYAAFSGNSTVESPYFTTPNSDPIDSDIYGFNRNKATWNSDMPRTGEIRPRPGLGQDRYERQGSPMIENNDFLRRYHRNNLFSEDQVDLPEDDTYYFHGSKKLKTNSFTSDKELLEFPFSGTEHDKHKFSRTFSDFPQHEVFENNIEVRTSSGYKQMPDRPFISTPQPHGDRIDHWRVAPSPYDGFPSGSDSLVVNSGERKRLTPESERPSLLEWKWEGTIAKGGTPVCRARCFPVGKVMDIMLPEFLDCSARTGLDMLAKHYYQAIGAWVVFFVPHSDADMVPYNEFLHYLGEKQRAAVAKLDDETTLFLVPPSDFSEKVLKVPGKLSISGVVLRLEHPGSSSSSISHQRTTEKAENRNSHPPFHGDAYFPNPSAHSRAVPDFGVIDPPFPNPPSSFPAPSYRAGQLSESYNENRHDYSHHMQNSVTGIRNMPPVHEQHKFAPRTVQETNQFGSQLYGTGMETRHSAPLSIPPGTLQPEQIAQLAASLLGAGNKLNLPMGEDSRHTTYQPDNHQLRNSNQVGSEIPTNQLSQRESQLMQQLHQHHTSYVPVAMAPVVQRESQATAQGNLQLQVTGTAQEAEADPQKRLQATLQLAAVLLQQIQQKPT